MTEIIPAILPEDYEDLRVSLASIRSVAPFVQVDICDGEYVPSVTWPYGDAEKFEDILSGDEGLPFWRDFQFELDLMVSRPEEVIDDWIDAGASRIVVHNNSTDQLEDILSRLAYSQIERGVALQIDEDTANLKSLAEEIDFVQCMGIAQIGRQGEPFDERAIEKVRELRNMFPDKPISVDGGVSFSTAGALAEAGATRLISGSAILGAKNPREAYEELQKLTSDM